MKHNLCLTQNVWRKIPFLFTSGTFCTLVYSIEMTPHESVWLCRATIKLRSHVEQKRKLDFLFTLSLSLFVHPHLPWPMTILDNQTMVCSANIVFNLDDNLSNGFNPSFSVCFNTNFHSVFIACLLFNRIDF